MTPPKPSPPCQNCADLSAALEAGKTRYSRHLGEPDPTPAFPVEVVFTMPQWYKVLEALGKQAGLAAETAAPAKEMEGTEVDLPRYLVMLREAAPKEKA